MIRVRFAPSPTGYIHIGNTRPALFNWLYTKAHGGKFVLRYDDTDQERSKQEYIDMIAVDLDWLGIKPDAIYYQSKRFARYDEVVSDLKAKGVLYPCYESAEELERRRKIRLSRKLPPIYGREALRLTKAEKQTYESEGRKPHWRFLLPNFKDDPFITHRTEIVWDDMVRGKQVIDLASMSDPILVREDDTYLYTLPSVVDDIDMEITDIIRGDDHVTNTGVQIAIFTALGASIPRFGHINLLTNATGEGLSKRKGALSIRSLREEGFEPMAVASLAVLIGTSENVQPHKNQDSLLAGFHLDATSKSAAKFDPADLLHLNRQLIYALSYEEVQSRLKALGIHGEKARDFWLMIRSNIDKLNDALPWWEVLHAPILTVDLSDEDKMFVREAQEELPLDPFDEETWRVWTKALKDKTGRGGRTLFMPLRKALTGRDRGPEMASLLPLLGREIVLKRLNAF
ncbi:glutamate--tRNA ligase [Bartonella sp. DGB2]|uniref:glutamate--tRNA ligase n=1 Tax=Bartonella sp. DGB2 TaxID=3388426 RepID=UPI00398F94CE